jgi:hypothetical protein
VSFACFVLGKLAVEEKDAALLMARAGAHEALLGMVDRCAREDDEEWDEAQTVAQELQVGDCVANLVPWCSLRPAPPRRQRRREGRDPWPVVLDRLRLIRLELLTLPAWPESAWPGSAATPASPWCWRRARPRPSQADK